MATAILTRRSNKTAQNTATTRRLIRVELPCGTDDNAATQAPLHAVISQLEDYQPIIDQLTEADEAKAEAAAINEDSDMGMRAWGCKIVGIIVEVPASLAKRLANNSGDCFGRRNLDDADVPTKSAGVPRKPR